MGGLRSLRSALCAGGVFASAIGGLALGVTATALPAGAAVTLVVHPLPATDAHMGVAAIVEGADGNLWYTGTAAQIGRMTPSGVVTDFPVPTANPGLDGIAAGSDGALWFAENAANKIGRATTAGVVTEFPLPSGGSPQYITAGPDGALWFTEESARRIGRIATNGAITEFPIPAAGARGAEDIVTGSDGNLGSRTPSTGRLTV